MTTRNNQAIIEASYRCVSDPKMVSEISEHVGVFFGGYIERADKEAKSIDKRHVVNITKQFDAMLMEKVVNLTVATLVQDGTIDASVEKVRGVIGGQVHVFKDQLKKQGSSESLFCRLITDAVNNKLRVDGLTRPYPRSSMRRRSI